jgi:hypothetical protein
MKTKLAMQLTLTALVAGLVATAGPSRAIAGGFVDNTPTLGQAILQNLSNPRLPPPGSDQTPCCTPLPPPSSPPTIDPTPYRPPQQQPLINSYNPTPTQQSTRPTVPYSAGWFAHTKNLYIGQHSPYTTNTAAQRHLGAAQLYYTAQSQAWQQAYRAQQLQKQIQNLQHPGLMMGPVHGPNPSAFTGHYHP